MISKIEENITILDERTRKVTLLATEVEGSLREIESRVNEALVKQTPKSSVDSKVMHKFKEALDQQAKEIFKDLNSLERKMQESEKSLTSHIED